MTDRFTVKHGVPSMAAEFARHDLAITAGGITPFEANASGLPCIVVSTELFEKPVGRALQELGGSIYAGHRDTFRLPQIDAGLPLSQMSFAGMRNIGLGGVGRVVAAAMELL